MNKKYDVIIIGAGPIGLACGIEAQKNNLDHLIIEKGCLVNSIFNYPKNMHFFSTSEKLEIGNVPFVSHGLKPTRTEALEYYRRVKEYWKLNVNTFEKVLSIKKVNSEFILISEENKYKCKYIIIATGFYDFPNLMNVPGEELKKVKHYYHEPYPYSFKKILVVGSGNSAVDAALETYRCSAEVKMVIKNNSIDESVKYWVKPDIENRIKNGEIKAYFNSSLIEIREKEVDIITPVGLKTIKNDFVLAMTGYKPDYNFLESIGIKIIENEYMQPVYNKHTYESNIKSIYLAGVVCGGLKTNEWFIENSREHAPIIFRNIKKSITLK